MSDQFFWFVTRSSALLCWLSAALSMLVGLVTSSRLLGRRPTIPWLVDFHRLLAALAVTFLGVHMVSLWLDSFVKFGPADLLIPWVATVPGLTRTSIALGVIAAWLLAAVQISSLIKDRLPETVWRTIHMLSFGTLAAGTLHAVQAGSEADNPLVVGIGVSMLTAIALAASVRAFRLRQSTVTTGTAQPSRTAQPARSARSTRSAQPTRSARSTRSARPARPAAAAAGPSARGAGDAGRSDRPVANGRASGASAHGNGAGNRPVDRSGTGRRPRPAGPRTNPDGTRQSTPRRRR